MGSKRSDQREKIMQTLYQIDIYKDAGLDSEIDSLIEESIKDENDFFKDLLLGTYNNLDKIDKEANTYLKDWDIKRLDKAGAAILRMSLYEFETDTPKKVIINEALNLAKKYSSTEVKNMINACLDKRMKS